jgi:hypothetical protein
MTRASRGISEIQEHARGNKMKKDMAPRTSKTTVKVAKKRPMAPGMGDMSVGAARSANLKNVPGLSRMGGMKPGMKSGGSCKGYAKGGAIDGVAHKGKTKGKIC